jgi:putative ABC transport system substrate-binding protein
MAASLYPVEQGIVASLAHPGSNVTGVATFTPDLIAKRVQILKNAVPTVSRVAVIRQPGRSNDLIIHDLEMGARTLSVQLDPIAVQSPDELSGAFQVAIRHGDHAIMTTQGPFFSLHRTQIPCLALEHRLPSLSGEAAAPAAGTLLFYGPSVWEDCEHSARYVDRILKGAKPSDLPVEQPTKFELVINLKTAKALGLTIPPSVLARADEVIH